MAAATIANGNPIVVTAGTSQSAAFNANQSSGATKKDIKVYKIYWFRPATTSDTFTLVENISGKTLEQGQCETSDVSQTMEFPTEKPLILPLSSDWYATCTSGTLYIYHL